MKDSELVFALMLQVKKAVNYGTCISERDVTTIITRPMWRRFLRATGDEEDLEPTEWSVKGCRRVYGSRTIVVESDRMAAVSFAR